MALGLLAGVLFRLPLSYVWLSVQAVAWKAGWVSIDPTIVDDGIAVVLMVAAGLLVAVLSGAVVASWWVSRYVTLSARVWWRASVALWLLPFVVLDLAGLISQVRLGFGG